MRLHPHEFIRRFLMHVLPKGFHRIRHYGLFANANRAESTCERCSLLVPTWLHAGDDLARPQPHPSVRRSPVDALRAPAESLLHSPDLPRVQTSRGRRDGVVPTIKLGADIKSP